MRKRSIRQVAPIATVTASVARILNAQLVENLVGLRATNARLARCDPDALAATRE